MTPFAWVLLGVALGCGAVVCVLGYELMAALELARACDDDWPLGPNDDAR